MLISIIVPCYNVETYIEECLKSVYTQSYSRIEVICIDNNSSDQTYKKLQVLQAMYPNLILGSETKKGANAARNKGLKMAKGEWIQFLDADDLLKPEKLEHQLRIIECNPTLTFIAGSSTKLSLTGESTENIVTEMDHWIALATSGLGNTCANFFKKEALLQINGWDENLQSSQETDLMFRLLQNDTTVYFDDKPFTIIRTREAGAISQTNLEANLLRFINVRYKLFQYLEEIQEKDEVKQAVLQILFDRVRELYSYNPEKSVELFQQIIPKSFVPAISPATTNSFLLAYKLLGFKNAQKLKKLLW